MFIFLEPRSEAMRRGFIDKSHEPFSVRTKQFYELPQARALIGPKFTESLGHEPDGLIFQPSIKVPNILSVTRRFKIVILV